jgi:alkylation response protein AidB-like acyl-CoA dehydrogenase
MNFELSDEQRLLVDSVSTFAKKQSPLTRLRETREEPLGFSREVWKQMGDLGWLAMSLPESVGGLGQSFVDVALILEHLAKTLVPEPILPAMVAASTIVRLGSEEQQQRWLAPLATGDAILALAWAERQGRYDVANVETRAEKSGDGWRIAGKKRFVLAGHAAEALIVSARTSGGSRDREGVSLFVIDRDAKGLAITPIKTMDGHRAAMIALDGVEVSQDRLLGAEGAATTALEAAMDIGAAGACAEAAGITRAALEMTTDYLRTREQFGVKIGSFQALQHRAVDMFVETELCKSTAILAAIKADDADESERKSAISAAKVQLSTGGRFVVAQATQLHGGIGVTDEHDIGLFFKRMNVLAALYGDEEHHVARYASLPGFTAGLAHSAA